MKYEYRPLSELCTLTNGYPFKSKDFCDRGIPVIKIANVKPNQIISNKLQCVSEDVASLAKKAAIHKGDILLTMTGNRFEGTPDSWVGKVARFNLDGDFLLNQRLCIVRPNNNVNPAFFTYALSSWDAQLYFVKHATSSGGQANISPKIVNSFEIACPPIMIQDRIASVLQSLDEKISINNQINENLQEQARAIYHHMIIENADAAWTPGVLSDIAVITMGQSPKGESYNEDGVGTVFFQGRAEFGFRYPTRRLYTTDPKRMAQANDALMSVRAPVGDMNVAYEDCCIGRGLGAIRSKDGHQSFVLYTMFALREQLNVFNGEGTVFGSINRDALNSMPVDIPPKEIMDQFEDIVAPMDAAIRNNYDEICRLQAMRDSLLPRLMSGELDISDIDL